MPVTLKTMCPHTGPPRAGPARLPWAGPSAPRGPTSLPGRGGRAARLLRPPLKPQGPQACPTLSSLRSRPPRHKPSCWNVTGHDDGATRRPRSPSKWSKPPCPGHPAAHPPAHTQPRRRPSPRAAARRREGPNGPRFLRLSPSLHAARTTPTLNRKSGVQGQAAALRGTLTAAGRTRSVQGGA